MATSVLPLDRQSCKNNLSVSPKLVLSCACSLLLVYWLELSLTHAGVSLVFKLRLSIAIATLQPGRWHATIPW